MEDITHTFVSDTGRLTNVVDAPSLAPSVMSLCALDTRAGWYICSSMINNGFSFG